MVRNISPLEINHVLNGCSPSARSNLTVEKTRFGATHPNQSTGMVPKNHPLSDDLHPDSQFINSPLPQYSEWDETNHGHSLSSTLNAITPSAKRARQHCQPILSENTETGVDAKDDADGFVNPELEPGVQRAPPKSGASKQASRSPCPPGCVGQCFQTVSPGASIYQVFHAGLNAVEEELKQIEFTVDFAAWIYNSHFLRFQQ